MSDEILLASAFPRLGPDRLRTLDAHTRRATFADGEELFHVGDRDVPFFIVRRGAIAIYEGCAEQGHEVRVHEPGEFSGDIDTLTGKPVVVTAVARGETEADMLSGDELRSLVRQHAWFGEIVLEAFFSRRRLLQADAHATRLIGSRYSADTFRIREFLSRHTQPHKWTDLESEPDIEATLRSLNVRESETPVLLTRGRLLRNPSNAKLAEVFGIVERIGRERYDVAIIGAGPAGLAAAVYAASEGLNTIVLEQTSPGGQAGTSSRIENYLGFPAGLSGADLMDRATMQAQKFGARIASLRRAVRLSCNGGDAELELEDGETVYARALIVATGADYRRLEIPERERFEGAGIYYAATGTEVPLCEGGDAVVIGAGNSAGQATAFLSDHVGRVHLLVRSDDLCKSMSRYLVHRLENTPNVQVHLESECVGLYGNGRLEAIRVRSAGREGDLRTPAVFSMIGAVPRTAWLGGALDTDDKGFIRTGGDGRLLLETSLPGVFAGGDVRSGSSKRVAAAVGEGALAVQLVHQFFTR